MLVQSLPGVLDNMQISHPWDLGRIFTPAESYLISFLRIATSPETQKTLLTPRHYFRRVHTAAK